MRILILDTETGGFEPKVHALLSITIGEFELSHTADPRRISLRSFDLIPHKDMGVCQSALAIQKLSWSDLEATHRLEEAVALSLLSEWLAEPTPLSRRRSQLPIWAHNAPFDRDFLTAALSRYYPDWSDRAKATEAYSDIDNAICYLGGRDARWNCSRFLAEKLVGCGQMEPARKEDGTISCSLDYLMQKFGMPKRDGHTAQQDVKITAEVLTYLLRLDGAL